MNAWDGTHLWIWEPWNVLGGDVDEMIAKAKEMGVAGVLIKLADGNLVGDPVSQRFMDTFKEITPRFKAAGLRVGGWIYQYLTDVAGEVDACAQAIAAGAEWIVLDGESDVYGKNAQVQQFGQLFRGHFPNVPVGLSSFAIANYHAAVPFAEYAAFVDVMMPQIYWAEMGWDAAVAFNASIASYQQFGKPIASTGQAYSFATKADMTRFVQLAKAAGHSGISWWDWQHMTADHVAGVQANIVAEPAPVRTVPVPPQAAAPAVVAKDVSAGAWSEKAIAYCVDEKIMTVDAAGNFRPTEPVTREQLAQAIYNTRHQQA